jgi:uncharacterized protein YcfL
MKRPYLALLTLLGLLLTGCQADQSPGTGYADPYPPPLNDPQITVLDPELRQVLGFQPAVVVDDGERPMHVQVPVRNLTERQYLIDYRILFHDANGVQIEPVMGWKFVSLQPKQVQRLDAKALDRQAQSYRLEVKWAK